MGFRLERNNRNVNRPISVDTHKSKDILENVKDFLETEQIESREPVFDLYESIVERLELHTLLETVLDNCECDFDREPFKEKFDAVVDSIDYIATYSIYEEMELIAPRGCRFGMQEGDGACLGFWEDDPNLIVYEYYEVEDRYVPSGPVDEEREFQLKEELLSVGLDSHLDPNGIRHGGFVFSFNDSQRNEIMEILNEYSIEIIE